MFSTLALFAPAANGATTTAADAHSVTSSALDQNKQTSRSAENLLESTCASADKKLISNRRSGSKKDRDKAITAASGGSGGSFFSRLFGFRRKSSEEGDRKSVDKVSSSLQENAEFFKPLQMSEVASDDEEQTIQSDVTQNNQMDTGKDNNSLDKDMIKSVNLNELDAVIPSGAGVSSATSLEPSPRTTSSFLYSNTRQGQRMSSAKTVSISPDNTMDKKSAPLATLDTKCSGDSVSQSSLLSDGSLDAKSVSSREEQGSSGDSQTLRHRKSRPKSQAVSRKMLEAPPPPPPLLIHRSSVVDKRVTIHEDKASSKAATAAATKSPSPCSPSKSHPFSLRSSHRGKGKRNSTCDDGGSDKKPPSPKRLEISAPLVLQSSTLNESQTLPRPVKTVSDNLVTETRDDSHMTNGRRKRFDSAAKHSRNRTVTEGVKFDTTQYPPVPDVKLLNERIESSRSNHKFVNRALPPTPTAAEVSQNMPKKVLKSVTIQECVKSSYNHMNEDIYTDPIEEGEAAILSSALNRKSLVSRDSLHSTPDRLQTPLLNSLKLPNNYLADYLEPSNPENMPSFVKPAIASKPTYGNGVAKLSCEQTPELLPRRTTTTTPPQKQSGDGVDPYVSMIYVNTEMIMTKTRPPIDVGEGFRRMAFINVETLLHVANTIQVQYIHQDADINDELKFSHFVLKSTKPYVNQGVVSFFNARTYKLKPSECLLMISAKYINPDLLHHSCVHMLQPSLIFSDRILATYFPDVNKTTPTTSPTTSPTDTTKSKVYQLGGMVHTNMAVITYHSIETFDAYVTRTVHRKMTSREPYERLVCYLWFQILNAILSAHDGSSLYTVKSVKCCDILVVEHSVAKGEPYVIVNPLRSADFERLDEELLCQDLIELLCYLIKIETEVQPRSRSITSSTRFATGMKRMLDILADKSFSGLLVARSIVEYLLWGPSDKEMKSILLAEDRQQAFCIWLEVNRCKYVNELALGQLNRNLELSHMFHFLCAVTGSNLLDVTKLLYKSSGGK